MNRSTCAYADARSGLRITCNKELIESSERETEGLCRAIVVIAHARLIAPNFTITHKYAQEYFYLCAGPGLSPSPAPGPSLGLSPGRGLGPGPSPAPAPSPSPSPSLRRSLCHSPPGRSTRTKYALGQIVVRIGTVDLSIALA